MTDTLHGRFADAARRWPDNVAVHADDGLLTYAELAAAVADVAAALTEAGGAPGDRVGLLLDHGVRPVAAIMGALAAGRCYVPLDPSWPAARLAHMCSHADVSAVITTSSLAALAARLSSAPTVVLGSTRPEPRTRAVDTPDTRDGSADPAYILYTSGSTGLPKGVVQSHRNVLHGVRNHVTNLRITPRDRVSLLTSFSFDMAVTDLFSALLTGAAVVTVDVRRHGLGHLADALDERGVTIYHSTPTVYRYLADLLRSATPPRRLPAVRTVLLGGEEVTSGDVRAARELFAEECVLVNGYGATEVSFAVQNHVRPGDEVADGVLPIGHVLDGYEVLLSEGTHGEIGIRSDHLALGYWRDPERTAQRFVDGVYRTGDLGTLLPNGALVYRGRADRQVKLRGYRVELGDVEAHLEALPGVARAVAVVRGEGLVGYLQPSAAADALDVGAVRLALAERLPEYQVPGTFVVCELPLTPTGKVDVLALPEPGAADDPADRPATPTERVVHDAWSSVLGLPAVGVSQSFFDLGGHSLMLARVQQKLEAELGTRVSLVELLTHPTIRAQAAHLAAATDPAGPAGVPAAPGGAQLDAVARRMAQRAAQRGAAANAAGHAVANDVADPQRPRRRPRRTTQEDTP